MSKGGKNQGGIKSSWDFSDCKWKALMFGTLWSPVSNVNGTENEGQKRGRAPATPAPRPAHWVGGGSGWAQLQDTVNVSLKQMLCRLPAVQYSSFFNDVGVGAAAQFPPRKCGKALRMKSVLLKSVLTKRALMSSSEPVKMNPSGIRTVDH